VVGSCKHSNEPSGSLKRWGNSGLKSIELSGIDFGFTSPVTELSIFNLHFDIKISWFSLRFVGRMSWDSSV
jgi:hypothetical protein